MKLKIKYKMFDSDTLIIFDNKIVGIAKNNSEFLVLDIFLYE